MKNKSLIQKFFSKRDFDVNETAALLREINHRVSNSVRMPLNILEIESINFKQRTIVIIFDNGEGYLPTDSEFRVIFSKLKLWKDMIG